MTEQQTTETYLDNAATTKPYPSVVSIMSDALTTSYYNPSAFYKPSIEAEKQIKTAREELAAILGVKAAQLYFTSGGTEGDNTIIRGVCERQRGNTYNIVTTGVEHPAVAKVFQYYEERGIDVRRIPVDSFGRIALEDLAACLDDQTALVSLMAVNNELGTIQNLVEAGKTIRAHAPKTFFHSDFVQAFCKTADSRLDIQQADLDAVTICAHKIHGPRGIGAVYLRDRNRCLPLMLGGGQEGAFRSGTENTAGILGFAEAAKIGAKQLQQNNQKLTALKDQLLTQLSGEDMIINSPEDGVPGIISLAFPGVRSEVLLHMLEERGIYVSSGSACSTHHKDGAIHKILGYDTLRADGTIRISPSYETTTEDINRLAEALKADSAVLRRLLKYKRK